MAVTWPSSSRRWSSATNGNECVVGVACVGHDHELDRAVGAVGEHDRPSAAMARSLSPKTHCGPPTSAVTGWTGARASAFDR